MSLPYKEKDLLLTAAIEFNKLIGKKIELILGRKGKSEKIVILFQSCDFHHLVGLHKLKDIPVVLKRPAKQVFYNILNKRICIADINKSAFFDMIINRLEIISQINDIFTKKSKSSAF